MNVAIIGAGPAGLTAAYQLAKNGVDVEVFEAGPSVGGLAKSLELWNQKVDLGPHRFFSNNKQVNELWLEVVGSDYGIVSRLTRIFYKGKFYAYPLEPLSTLGNLGLMRSLACVASFLKEQLVPTPLDGSFENWVVRHFGRRLFEIFFKSYSEKLWGIPCKDIDADFAAQRIRKLSLYEAVKHAFMKDKTAKHRTLTERFAYPHGGTGIVYERMAGRVQNAGGKVHCLTPIRRVLLEGKKVAGLQLDNGTVRPFDRIVSSMPLTSLVSRLPEAPQEVLSAIKSLRFRNTILVYLNIPSEDLFRDQWIYIQSPDIRAGRVTNYRNWVPQLYGNEMNTVVAMEYWCSDTDPLWQENDERLISLAIEELGRVGFDAAVLKKSSGHVQRLPKSYPVYHKGYKEKLKLVKDFLVPIEGLTVIGRYGAFKYNNQDHSILMGILAAENILSKKHHDLWAVNNDYESYQEQRIGETGSSIS